MERLTIGALAAHGDSPAIVSATSSLTYAELAARAALVVRSLRKLGILPGAAVALVSSGRSFDEAVGLAGILASGCLAVPIDPAAPAQRLANILKSRGCRAIVCDEGAQTLANAIDAAMEEEALVRLVLDDQGTIAAPAAPSSPTREITLRDISVACILHTSGSTGTPKPVPITWAGLDAFAGFWIERIGLRPGDRVLRVAELVFDLAWFDHIATFRAGATLVIMTRRELAAGRALRDAIKALKPTVIYGVPSLFMKLSAAMSEGETLGHDGGDGPGDSPKSGPRSILFAGEIFPPRELLAFSKRVPAAELWNLYGPTETNVCTYHHVERASLDGVRETPIGVACPYSPCELIAEDGSIIEGPGTGELYVSGPSTVGGGPFPTRDRVERGADGLFYFRGRIDRMVKIRGYRVEPGEIEVALSRHPAVAQAACLAVEDARLGTVLHAHVARKADAQATTDRDLRMFLSEILPPYMVPEKVFLLDELPRTTTGKIDYQALAASRP